MAIGGMSGKLAGKEFGLLNFSSVFSDSLLGAEVQFSAILPDILSHGDNSIQDLNNSSSYSIRVVGLLLQSLVLYKLEG